MKHQKIERSARVWTVSRGPDGRLQEEIDADLLAAQSDEIAEAIIRAAAEAEIAKIRAW